MYLAPELFFSDKNIENILLNIRENGTEIVIISQCISGEISVGKYDNSNIFKRIGAISGGDLTAESALTKAMHLIENPYYKESFSTLFSKNLRGEMSN